MKKSIFFFALLLSVSVFTAFALYEVAQNKYVGVGACKGCHNAEKKGKQYAIWEKTAHANAYKTLLTPEADKIAKGKAVDNKTCLGCHVTGMHEANAQFDAKFAKEEGVGCEACHGAGSAFKSKHMKKEGLPDAIAAGMLLPKVGDGSAEKVCKGCHNSKSPTFKAFKFQEMWKKIAHPLPA
jgi:hypothetical protein